MSRVIPVTFDYKDHSILINWKDQNIKLQKSTKEATIELIPYVEDQPRFHQEEAYFLVQLTAINGERGGMQDLAPEYQELLQQYSDIFAVP